jgi:hypothetical protein
MLYSRHWKTAKNNIMEFYGGHVANYTSSSSFSSVLSKFRSIKLFRISFFIHLFFQVSRYFLFFFEICSVFLSYKVYFSPSFTCGLSIALYNVTYPLLCTLFYGACVTLSLCPSWGLPAASSWTSPYRMSILRTSSCFVLNFTLSYAHPEDFQLLRLEFHLIHNC